jgi:hypothetical protein
MGGFKPRLKLGEDFDLWIRIALKYQTVLINKPLAYYNQDVEQATRGVAFDKIYDTSAHFIFNLDYLQQEEKENQTLHQMLDNLRVYTLERYYIQNKFQNEFKREISKVNFSKQPKSVQRFYKTPRKILNLKKIVINTLIKIKN